MTKRRSNWYIYLITFAITGVLLYIVSSALLSSFNEKRASENTSSGPQGSVFRPGTVHNFTMLAMLSDTADDVPEYYMLVNYRGDKNAFTIVPFLGDTSFGSQTLYQGYINGGADQVMSIFSSALDAEITKYVKFSESSLTEFFNSVGNTTLSVPKEYKYENKEDKTLSIVYAGTYSFTGAQLYSYLTFPDFGEDNSRYACKVHGVAYSAFINQNFFRVSESTLAGYFNYLVNFTDTNLSEEDFAIKKQALLYTFSNVNEPCDYYIPYGDEGEDKYTISDGSISTIKEKLFYVD